MMTIDLPNNYIKFFQFYYLFPDSVICSLELSQDAIYLLDCLIAQELEFLCISGQYMSDHLLNIVL
jgi:hypothetical protein